MKSIWRRLTLSHDGRAFLDRWGLVHDRIGGIYVHHIAGPDPGFDLHDHPWAFATFVLSGGYIEEQTRTKVASACAMAAERWPETCQRGHEEKWGRWSFHRMPLAIAHRITDARPGTWTVVLRGPTRRVWGFYLPEGRVEWEDYDYRTRRPSHAMGNRPGRVEVQS